MPPKRKSQSTTPEEEERAKKKTEAHRLVKDTIDFYWDKQWPLNDGFTDYIIYNILDDRLSKDAYNFLIDNMDLITSDIKKKDLKNVANAEKARNLWEQMSEIEQKLDGVACAVKELTKTIDVFHEIAEGKKRPVPKGLALVSSSSDQ